MSREVPFDENEVCDNCGKKGAYDFMGDCFCADCLDKMDEARCMKQKIIKAVKEMPNYNFGLVWLFDCLRKKDVINVIKGIE